jgi:hypothetical protein
MATVAPCPGDLAGKAAELGYVAAPLYAKPGVNSTPIPKLRGFDEYILFSDQGVGLSRSAGSNPAERD